MEIGRRQGAAACSTGTPLDIIVRVVLPIMAVYYKQRRTSEIFETSTVLQIAGKVSCNFRTVVTVSARLYISLLNIARIPIVNT